MIFNSIFMKNNNNYEKENNINTMLNYINTNASILWKHTRLYENEKV